MYITFVVKDSSPEVGSEAHRAVRGHGIEARRVNCTRDAVVYSCAAQYVEPLARWFAQNEPITPGVGYPDGTCLIYSFHE